MRTNMRQSGLSESVEDAYEAMSQLVGSLAKTYEREEEEVLAFLTEFTFFEKLLDIHLGVKDRENSLAPEYETLHRSLRIGLSERFGSPKGQASARGGKLADPYGGYLTQGQLSFRLGKAEEILGTWTRELGIRPTELTLQPSCGGGHHQVKTYSPTDQGKLAELADAFRGKLTLHELCEALGGCRRAFVKEALEDLGIRTKIISSSGTSHACYENSVPELVRSHWRNSGRELVLDQVAAVFDISIARAYKLLTGLELGSRRRQEKLTKKYPPTVIGQLEALSPHRSQYVDVANIAETLSLSEGTVHEWLKELGIVPELFKVGQRQNVKHYLLGTVKQLEILKKARAHCYTLQELGTLSGLTEEELGMRLIKLQLVAPYTEDDMRILLRDVAEALQHARK